MALSHLLVWPIFKLNKIKLPKWYKAAAKKQAKAKHADKLRKNQPKAPVEEPQAEAAAEAPAEA